MSPISAATNRMPDGQEDALHVLNRLAFGPRSGDIERLTRLGARDYVNEQLGAENLAEPSSLNRTLAGLQTLQMDAATLFVTYGPPAMKRKENDPQARKMLRRRGRVILE